MEIELTASAWKAALAPQWCNRGWLAGKAKSRVDPGYTGTSHKTRLLPISPVRWSLPRNARRRVYGLPNHSLKRLLIYLFSY